jgi:hypothetical protein
MGTAQRVRQRAVERLASALRVTGWRLDWLLDREDDLLASFAQDLRVTTNGCYCFLKVDAPDMIILIGGRY